MDLDASARGGTIQSISTPGMKAFRSRDRGRWRGLRASVGTRLTPASSRRFLKRCMTTGLRPRRPSRTSQSWRVSQTKSRIVSSIGSFELRALRTILTGRMGGIASITAGRAGFGYGPETSPSHSYGAGMASSRNQCGSGQNSRRRVGHAAFHRSRDQGISVTSGSVASNQAARLHALYPMLTCSRLFRLC